MVYFLILALLSGSMIFAFLKFRSVDEKFRWSDLTFKQHASLSLALASLIQFFLITVIPGWVIEASIVGYNDIYTTPLESIFFGVITLLSNTLIYYFNFYFLIGCLSRLIEMKTSNSITETSSILKQ